MKSMMVRLLAVMAGSAAFAACASAPLGRAGVAYATISNAAGDIHGAAELWQDRDNIVHVGVEVAGLTPGEHGIHFHAVGVCDGSGTTAFSTAGGHYNPIGREHGLENPAGPHAGDAPNLTAGADGIGRATFTTDRVTLTDGSTSLFDDDGSSIVIHAAADDQKSQPAGNSGARMACGVVKRTP
jgi:Cu-Zn family superoxide dismutase